MSKVKTILKSFLFIIIFLALQNHYMFQNVKAATSTSYNQTVVGTIEIGYDFGGDIHEYSKSSPSTLWVPINSYGSCGCPCNDCKMKGNAGTRVYKGQVAVDVTRKSDSYTAQYSVAPKEIFTDTTSTFSCAAGQPDGMTCDEWGSYVYLKANFAVGGSMSGNVTIPSSYTSSDSYSVIVSGDSLSQYAQITSIWDGNPDWVIDINKCTANIVYVKISFTYPPLPVTVEYDLNGGAPESAKPESVSVAAGKSISLASTKATKANCEFLGWSLTKKDTLTYGQNPGSSCMVAGSAFTVNNNVTLYAVWRTVKVPYTLQFKLNGKLQNNDYAYVTGTVNGKQTVSNSRSFSALEVPGYTVSASVKSSDSSVFIINANNSAKSTDFVYNIPTKTIKNSVTDTVECGTIHIVM